MPPELLAQFPIAEQAIEALGLVLWPMVEFEADDAIAAAAERFAADPRVERVVVCTPDKDMAQLVGRRADRALGPAARPRPTTTRASARSGAWRPRACRTAWRSWATRPTATRGCPGWGDKSASAVLARYGHFEIDPGQRQQWDVAGLRNPVGLATTLRDHMAEALLYRDLARLRTTADGVEIPQRDVDELEWRGAERAAWEAFCDELGPRATAGPAAPLGVASREAPDQPGARRSAAAEHPLDPGPDPGRLGLGGRGAGLRGGRGSRASRPARERERAPGRPTEPAFGPRARPGRASRCRQRRRRATRPGPWPWPARSSPRPSPRTARGGSSPAGRRRSPGTSRRGWPRSGARARPASRRPRPRAGRRTPSRRRRSASGPRG